MTTPGGQIYWVGIAFKTAATISHLYQQIERGRKTYTTLSVVLLLYHFMVYSACGEPSNANCGLLVLSFTLIIMSTMPDPSARIARLTQ